MDEEQIREFASQLRQPHGDFGKKVGELMNAGNAAINRNTIAQVQVQPHDRLLEIGMGNGFFVPEILTVDPSVRYTGCDFSEPMVVEARHRNEAYIQNGQAAFVLGTADRLPFPDENFNKVFTINTVYFWEDQAAVLREVRRVLKPEGVFHIAVRPKAVMELLPVVRYGFTLFSKEDLVAMLQKHGFTVCAIVEQPEPVQEVFGQQIPMETLIVSAKK